MLTYDFSTLYTKLPHNLIKEKITELFEYTFNRDGMLYLVCNEKRAFSYLNNLESCIKIIFYFLTKINVVRTQNSSKSDKSFEHPK